MTDQPSEGLISGPWEQRLDFLVQTMREMSRQTDPQVMVQMYGRRMEQMIPRDGWLSLSRRDLHPPQYRITRSSIWTQPVNPWRNKSQLPVFDRGILSELIYGEEPRIINDLVVDSDDPAAEYL